MPSAESVKIPTLATVRGEATALLRWWTRELRDIGQEVLVRIAPALVKQVVIEFKGSSAEAYVLRRGSASERITISRDPDGAWPERLPASEILTEQPGARATLVLASADIFSFDLLVPQAGRRDLDKVITLHLETALPLAHDQFGLYYRIRERLPNAGKIWVEVLVAHRTRLDQLRDLAQQWDLRAPRIAAPNEAGGFVGDFIRSPFRFRMIRMTLLERRLATTVLALTVMLGGLIAAQWVYERIVVGAKLRDISAQARVASRLADRLTRESAPARELLKIAAVPDASDVLAALTKAVPSYAWVYELHLEAPSTGAVVIDMGAFAPPSSTLVGDLEATRRFGTVQLDSATSSGGPSGLDRLTLTVSRTAQ